VCGHPAFEHTTGFISKIPVCAACRDLSKENEYHEFKLDNLKYVEQVAKERKLI